MTQELLNVLVTVNFSDAIMDRLKTISPRLKFIRKPVKAASDIAPEMWKTIDILYTTRVLPEPDDAPRLRWIQAHNAGVDHLLSQALLQNAEDITMTTVSGIHAPKIAEYTLAMMLGFAHKLPTMIRLRERADWPENRFDILLPRPLRGATLGIVGYGSIGRETARIAQAFGMEVLATKRNVRQPAQVGEYNIPETGDPEGVMVNRLYPPEALRSMLAECDFVQVTVPSIAGNKKMLGEGEFAVMKRSAILINIARGDVIDENALIKALQSGQIGGAALDVFEIEPLPATSPLWGMENVIISPHVAGNTDHYYEDAAEVFAANLERWLSNQTLLNVVDRKRGY
jgi:phosphoglycerate dehydrogenase-like enzyme